MNTQMSILTCTLASLLLAACSSPFEPVSRTTEVTDLTTISSTASLTHILVADNKSPRIVCSQPPPDAAFNQAEAGDIAFSISISGDDQSGESEDSEETEMSGRTPAVLMARELFYRLCEFSMNYKLDQKTAITLYTKTLDSITTVWGTEAGNTTVTIGDSLTTSNAANITASTTAEQSSTLAKSDTSTEENSDTTSDTTSDETTDSTTDSSTTSDTTESTDTSTETTDSDSSE
ncbi:MAG: hypothetical protein HOE83_03270 [Alphaproteobacteria bacterium]|nr:hypothetical protein [Alphaproteobacteria bacterium]